MARRKIKVSEELKPAAEMVRPHRLVPHQRIVEKTGLIAYDRALAFGGAIAPRRVAIPLSQHWGAAARPLVRVGDRVARGQLVANVPEGAPGAVVHASLHGVVVEINHSIVVEAR
jgi:predicted deacylase